MLKSSVEDKVNKVLLLLLSIGQPHNLPAQSGCVALTLDIVYTNRPLSFAEAFYSRALGKNIPGARRLGRGKIKAFPAHPFSLSSASAPVSFSGVY